MQKHKSSSSSSIFSSSFEEYNTHQTIFAPRIVFGTDTIVSNPNYTPRFATPRVTTPDSSNIASKPQCVLLNDSCDAMSEHPQDYDTNRMKTEGRHNITMLIERRDPIEPHATHNANTKDRCCNAF